MGWFDEQIRERQQANTAVPIGEYLGMKMSVSFDSFTRKFSLTVKDHLSHTVEVGSDPSGNITRINNALEGMSKQLEEAVTKLQNVEHQLETAKIEVTKPFPQEAELSQKLDRLAELNALLNMDEKGDEAMDVDDEYNLPKDTEEKCEQSSGFDDLGKRPSMRARLSEKIEIVAEQNSRPKDREVEAQRSYRSRNAPYISLVG